MILFRFVLSLSRLLIVSEEANGDELMEAPLTPEDGGHLDAALTGLASDRDAGKTSSKEIGKEVIQAKKKEKTVAKLVPQRDSKGVLMMVSLDCEQTLLSNVQSDLGSLFPPGRLVFIRTSFHSSSSPDSWFQHFDSVPHEQKRQCRRCGSFRQVAAI